MTDAVTVRVGRLGQVPAGLQHRYMVVDDARKLIVMCRQLRLDLAECALPARPRRHVEFTFTHIEHDIIALNKSTWSQYFGPMSLDQQERVLQSIV